MTKEIAFIPYLRNNFTKHFTDLIYLKKKKLLKRFVDTFVGINYFPNIQTIIRDRMLLEETGILYRCFIFTKIMKTYKQRCGNALFPGNSYFVFCILFLNTLQL